MSEETELGKAQKYSPFFDTLEAAALPVVP